MGSSMPNEPKRYLATIRLADDVPLDQLGRRIEGLRQLVSNLANGDVHLAFSSGDGRFVGMFFTTARDVRTVRAELDKSTSHADRFLFCEVGDLGGHKGMGAAATWLQRR
jgi:hypothetical protein